MARYGALIVNFFDLQELSNPMNGLQISNQSELDLTLEKLRTREPFSLNLLVRMATSFSSVLVKRSAVFNTHVLKATRRI